MAKDIKWNVLNCNYFQSGTNIIRNLLECYKNGNILYFYSEISNYFVKSNKT